jgi:hypothetical protein
MLQALRIAIGRCECTKPYHDAMQSKACEAIDARLQSWLTRLPADLGAVPVEAYEDVRVEGHVITVGTQKHALESGETLVVFQALVHTWSRPTFLSVGAVGRIYAEGLIVSATGTVQRAPDEVMWTFR